MRAVFQLMNTFTFDTSLLIFRYIFELTYNVIAFTLWYWYFYLRNCEYFLNHLNNDCLNNKEFKVKKKTYTQFKTSTYISK